jgi:hypothetical protein
MTLKERFKKQLDTAIPKLYRPFYQSKKCVEIAEEFAIGFAEWLIEKEREYPNRIIRGKELLEIYKKEKGL